MIDVSLCVCANSVHFQRGNPCRRVQDVQKAKASTEMELIKSCRHIQRPSHQFVHPTAFALELEDQAGSEYDSDPEPAQRSFFPVVDHRIPVIDHRTSLCSGSKSHRGILTDQSAQNRQQRRLQSASHCTGSAIIKPKFSSNRHNG